MARASRREATLLLRHKLATVIVTMSAAASILPACSLIFHTTGTDAEACDGACVDTDALVPDAADDVTDDDCGCAPDHYCHPSDDGGVGFCAPCVPANGSCSPHTQNECCGGGTCVGGDAQGSAICR